MAMAVATFPITIFSVLAADLIDEFGVSRGQVGLLVTASGLVGAVASPLFGRLTDRLGSVTSTRGVLGLGVVALGALALSPGYSVLFLAAVFSGLPNGWTNPATNSLIVDTVPTGRRGVVTGVKQSGVQVGASLGGLFLPLLAGIWDWRIAVAVFILMPVSGLLGMLGRMDPPHQRVAQQERVLAALPASVKWIAVYGAISGTATSAMFGFLPLFAEEELSWSPQAAGTLITVVGIAGVVARIGWPAASERKLGHGLTLRILAVASLVSAGLLTLAAVDLVPAWTLVPVALLLGGGAIAWNAVGMLAVMEFSPHNMVGKGTGVVLFGFLGGLAAGAPLMGVSVDVFETYVPGWLGVALLLIACAVIAGRIPSGSTLADS